MDLKLAQQETITELVLENQKLKKERDETKAYREEDGQTIDRLIKERDEIREAFKIAYNERVRMELEKNALIQKLDAWQEIAELLFKYIDTPAYGVEQAMHRMDIIEAYKHLKKQNGQ